MYNLKDFLNAVMSNTVIVLVEKNGLKHKTTTNKIGDDYNNRTFSHWDMSYAGSFTIYLD